jgi:ribosomal protein S18 acetylase RimI-like enzyme
MLGNSQRVRAASQDGASCQTSELASIGVIPSAQRLGIGRALVAAFLEHAERMGAQQVALTTDSANNDAVNGFYKSLGFQIVDTINAPGKRPMHQYVYRFDRGHARAA